MSEYPGRPLGYDELYDEDGNLRSSPSTSPTPVSEPDAPSPLTLEAGNGDRPRIAGAPVGLDGIHLTESGNAERLHAAHGDQIRFVPPWKGWLVWDPDAGVWVNDDSDVRVRARAMAALTTDQWHLIADADPSRPERDRHLRWTKQSEKLAVIRSSVELARSLPGVAVNVDDLDNQPMLLNCRNGVVNLETGRLEAHNPDHLHTKTTGIDYDPDADAPIWRAFLEQVLPDPEVREFVQRYAGYTLTGRIVEHVIVFMIGAGANGKTTLVEAIARALGDYARPVAKEVLIIQRHQASSALVADLVGVRMAMASEIEKDDRLAEAQVKNLTGGERIIAHKKFGHPFTFTPAHTTWLAANHRPRIAGTDHGIWRRIRLVPFLETIDPADQDPYLLEKLVGESAGILAWAIEGCGRWRNDGGLTEPAAVRDATDEYQRDEDWFAAFLNDKDLTVDHGRGVMTSSSLWEKYCDWCSSNREDPMSRTAFGRELGNRGLEQVTRGRARAWKGIADESQ